MNLRSWAAPIKGNDATLTLIMTSEHHGDHLRVKLMLNALNARLQALQGVLSSTGTGACAMIGPESTAASTK